jgi:hypothetical protein
MQDNNPPHETSLESCISFLWELHICALMMRYIIQDSLDTTSSLSYIREPLPHFNLQQCANYNNRCLPHLYCPLFMFMGISASQHSAVVHCSILHSSPYCNRKSVCAWRITCTCAGADLESNTAPSRPGKTNVNKAEHIYFVGGRRSSSRLMDRWQLRGNTCMIDR